MRASFEATVVVYALGVAVACVVAAVRGRSPLLVPALVLVEVSALAQAAIDVAGLSGGRTPPDLATHLGYLGVSILLLPIAAATVQLDDGRWGNAGLALGCAVLAVVSVRLHQTLGVPSS